LKTNIVSFKNRLKTRVALIELLDLSGIAVGNVGVPTCLNGMVCPPILRPLRSELDGQDSS
jgi:hypothetical protein